MTNTYFLAASSFFFPCAAILLLTYFCKQKTQKIIELSFNWLKCLSCFVVAFFAADYLINYAPVNLSFFALAGMCAVQFFGLWIAALAFAHFYNAWIKNPFKQYNYLYNLAFHLPVIVGCAGIGILIKLAIGV
jgi:hypothetical protein